MLNISVPQANNESLILCGQWGMKHTLHNNDHIKIPCNKKERKYEFQRDLR